jgi:hypothetical protein
MAIIPCGQCQEDCATTMNSRIQELAEQAKSSVPTGLVVSEWIEVYNQKLGELIIQDCIRTLHSNGYDDAAQCLQEIHFGIDDPV